MRDDRFSDTAELPLPKHKPAVPDPFAEAQRQNPQRNTQNPNHTNRPAGNGQPRRRLNGAAAPKPNAYPGDPMRQTANPTPDPAYPQRTQGSPNPYADEPQRPYTNPNPYTDYPQRRSETAHQRPQNPQRQVQTPPRQRIRQPGAPAQPHTQIRRASYQEQMPDSGKSMPYRQPQQAYRGPEFEEELPEPAPKKKKKHRKHHRHGCLRKIISGILGLAVFLFAMYSGAVLLAIKQLNYEETAPRAITATAAEQDAEVRNILLIGTDNREDERGRADTVILLSFSKHNHTVTMTSLMRDSYVSIPNHGTDKLNAAFAYGGATLLMDTIVNNYGIPVDDYICVNFKAFVHIADALGGIKVEVSDREAEAINVILQSEVNQIMGDDPMDDFLPSGGTFLLNGKQALAYARIRYVGNADFERTERQRTVLNLMLNKLKHISPTAIPKILTKAVPELKTNMTKGQLYLLSLQTPVKLIGYDMQKLRLPADGTYSDQTSPDGQMVLAVDFDANMQLYLKAIHDPPAPAPEEGEVTAP